jgi:hypothetical protein
MTTTIVRPEPRTRKASADWIGYAAAAWAAAYCALALIWTLSGRGYPFGDSEIEESTSILRALPPDVGAPLFAGILLPTAVAMLAIAGPHGIRLRGMPRLLLLTFGWTVVGFFVVAVPTVSLLALTGYAPMLILGAPFGWPPDVPYAEVFDWSLANQVIALGGAFLVAGALRAWQRRTRDACATCGRGEGRQRDVAQIGRVAVAISIAIPLMYAVTRYAWLVGIPLGVSDAMLRDLHDSGGVWAGAGLATAATGGAILTLGLVQRWGEVFPRWMPGLAGKRVPIKLAVIPASYVAAILMPAGVGLLTDPAIMSEDDQFSRWLIVPHALWPVWSVALGVATYAYYLRRRGACQVCGRDNN